MKNELSMPKGCTVLEEEEMMYVDGGSASLPMRTDYLSKSYCLSFADTLIKYRAVVGMTKQEVAEEIYGHAVLYYNAKYSVVVSLGIGLLARQYIINHSNPIDIADYGDTPERKNIYRLIWNNV